MKAILAAAVLTLAALPAEAGEINFVNRAPVTIQHLQLAPAGTEEWGEDELGDADEDSLATGDWHVVEDVEPGLYDIRLGDGNGGYCVFRDIEVGQLRVDFVVDDGMLDACPNFDR